VPAPASTKGSMASRVLISTAMFGLGPGPGHRPLPAAAGSTCPGAWRRAAWRRGGGGAQDVALDLGTRRGTTATTWLAEQLERRVRPVPTVVMSVTPSLGRGPDATWRSIAVPSSGSRNPQRSPPGCAWRNRPTSGATGSHGPGWAGATISRRPGLEADDGGGDRGATSGQVAQHLTPPASITSSPAGVGRTESAEAGEQLEGPAGSPNVADPVRERRLRDVGTARGPPG